MGALRLLFLVGVLLGQPIGSAGAQAIGRPRHPDVLARPTAVRTVRTCQPESLLAGIQAALRADSFVITGFDEVNQVIEAERTSPDERGPGVDRVIVWLQRDFVQPLQAIAVFMVYGRYDKTFGEPNPIRVQVDREYEVQRTRRLRERIMTYAAPTGSCP